MLYTVALRTILKKLDELGTDNSIAIPLLYTLQPTLLVVYNPDGSHIWGARQHPERYFLKSYISKRIVSDVDKNRWGVSAIYLYVDAGRPNFNLCYVIDELQEDSYSVTASVPDSHIPPEIKARWRRR
jgi:hypothetical protein